LVLALFSLAQLLILLSVGALQTALKRLEDKGYLKSFDGEATEERAGRPKKYFQITALGKKAMEYSKSTREELWNAIPKVAWDVKSLLVVR
jgi:PadR family transcriptional regulator PadR